MNKISTRFVVLLTVSVILTATILTYVSLNYGRKLILEGSQKKLLDELGSFTEKANSELYAKETYVRGMESIVSTTFDIDEFNSNPNYFDDYEDELLPFIKSYSSQSKSAYVFFNPLELGKTLDIWYFDRDNDGDIERIPQVGKDYYLDETGKEWFFVPVKERRGNWTDPYQGTIVTESVFVSYTRPVFKGDSIVAVVGTDFEYTKFQNELVNYEIYDTGYAFLFNEEHDFIVHPLMGIYEGIYEIYDGKYSWIVEEMQRKESGTIKYEWIDGEKKVLAYSHLRNGWIMGIVADESEIYKEIDDHAGRLVLISLILMVSVSLIGYHSSERITKPLKRIVEQVENIGSGDYDSKISSELISDVTEIGQLSDVVEDMRKNLKRAFQVIREQNQNLDLKVKERTLELDNANDELIESMRILKDTQRELLISEKQKSIAYIVIEIAHRINTPIGNTLTLLTFIEKLNKSLNMELKRSRPSAGRIKDIASSFERATSNAIQNIKKASGIIGSLKEFSFDEKNNKISLINFPDFVKKSVMQDKSVILDNVSVVLNTFGKAKVEFYSNPYLVFKLFTCLVSFSSFFRKKNSNDKPVDLHFKEDGEYVNIDYIDRMVFVPEEFKDKVFEPFVFTSFDTGAHGIELYLAYNIVTQGLGGRISYKDNSEGVLCIEINLPKKAIKEF